MRKNEMMETTNDTLKSMFSANSCVQEGQYSEAIQILEKLVNSGVQEGFVFLALGDVHRNLADERSSAKAKDYLVQAIEAAKGSKDHQVVIAAKASLGRMYLQEAQREFDNLHEEDRWIELCQKILDCNQVSPIPVLFMGLPCACTTPSNLPGRYVGVGDTFCKSQFCS
jgi:tetratricopeptide (TPR) repeat protein